MSTKGTIRKSIEPKTSFSSSHRTKSRVSGSHQVSGVEDEKAEKKEKRKEVRNADAELKGRSKSQVVEKAKAKSLSHVEDKVDRKEKKREPQIIDPRVSGDKVAKTRASNPINRSVLPDKNPLKIKQTRQNGISTSNSNVEKHTNAASVARKNVPVKTKSESFVRSDSVTKSSISSKPKSNVQTSSKEKTKQLYNEVRGSSSIYMPKDSASKLRSMTKSMNVKKSEERPGRSTTPQKPLPRHSSRERKNSRTLSPSEVKILKSTNNKPQAFKNDNAETTEYTESEIDESQSDEDDSEESDSELDDYVSSEISEESDDSDTSTELEPIVLHTEEKKKRMIVSADVRKTEEERMLDSGHYELTEAKKRAAIVESLMANRIKTALPLPEIKQPNNQSYRDEKHSENKSLPSSTDEGFEDSRSGDFAKSPRNSQVSEKLNFPKKTRKRPKKMTRGQILMNMIKLDTVELSLYECKPMLYDEFIRTYGKMNTQQTSSQTNEDNLDVEIQTDPIEVENKWTQFPVTCRNKLETIEDVRLFKLEHLGVGGDNSDSVLLSSPSYDILKLNEFLSRAGKVMLALLEEKESGGNILQNETHEFPFSEGYVKLSVSSLSFLCGRQVTLLYYSEISNKILLSIHASANEKIELENKQDYIMDCCIGCVWNVNEPSRPIKLFYSPSAITACCFHCTNNNIIFAGLQDGSICLWDLREEESWHQQIIDKVNEINWIVRSATYTTTGNWEIEAHKSPVVAIRIVSKMDRDHAENLNEKFISIQICSLDEEGNLIIWSVLRNLSSNSDDLGLTQWGKVKLVKSQEVPLFMKKNESNNIKKEFIDMSVDNVDSNNLYLATNSTDILYANCIGGRNNTLYYKISEMDSCGSTTCLEVCPFEQSYFFAGCNDGSIRLHSLTVETPILKLKDENSSAGIKNIQWSKSKPLTIFVLDDLSRIVVWDLSNSDIHPTHTVSTKSWGHVKCMRLSPCNTNRDLLNQYLALGTDTGNVEVHKLKKDFYFAQRDDLVQEMNTFLRYVSIL